MALALAGTVAAVDDASAQGVIIQGGDNVVVPTAIDPAGQPSQAAPAPTPKAAPQAQAPAQPKKAAVKKPKPAAKGEGEASAAKAAPERTAALGKAGSHDQSIVALVNDEPVTGYEVSVRAQMMAGGAAAEYVKANAQTRWKKLITASTIQDEFKAFATKRQPKSREEVQALQKEFIMGKQKAMMMQLQAEAQSRVSDKLKKQALEELIDERLKMQEAKRVGAGASPEEIDRIIDGIAARNKLTKEQLAKSLGGSLDPMKERVASTLAWNDVIRRKFGQQITIASKDVDKFVAATPGNIGGDDSVELQLQRIHITMPAKTDQAGVAQRVSQAEALRAKFTDCKSTSAIANGVPGARFEEIGKRKPAAFPEPTRSMLLTAKDNEMLPPAVGEDGIDLFAVCGRNVVKVEDEKRSAAEGELKQKEFEMLAKRHLKDLRQDAHIEYR